MKIDIDEDLGVAYIHIQKEGTPIRNRLINVIANLDFDEKENIIGIELLGWKKNV